MFIPLATPPMFDTTYGAKVAPNSLWTSNDEKDE